MILLFILIHFQMNSIYQLIKVLIYHLFFILIYQMFLNHPINYIHLIIRSILQLLFHYYYHFILKFNYLHKQSNLYYYPKHKL